MKLKRIVAVILSLVMVISLTACGSGTKPADTNKTAASAGSGTAGGDAFDNGPEVKFVIASAASSNNPTYTRMQEMAKNINTESKGKITVDVVFDATLGGDRELMEGCIAGNISAVSMSTSPQQTFIPEVAVFDMPMLFDNLDQGVKAFEKFKKPFNEIYNKKGLELISLASAGFREMTSNKNIEKIEDFKGVKIRTMENKYHEQFWSNVGAAPTPLSFSELYIALQQGLVDAQENPVMAIPASKFQEVQKYIIYTHHILFANTVIMNKKFYDGLPDAYKTLIQKEVDAYTQWTVDNQKKIEEDAIASLNGKMTEVEISDALRAEMKKAAEPVYDSIRADIGDATVDAMLEAVKEAK